MQFLHYTSKKLGHDCKSRAEYWQQRGLLNSEGLQKVELFSRQENNLLKLIVLLSLVQVRICYAEAHLH